MFEQFMVAIDGHSESIFQTLVRWSEINSCTDNLAGLARMQRELIDALNPLADEVRSLELPPAESINSAGNPVPRPLGRAIVATKRSNAPLRVLLVIHYDTVHSADGPFQKTHQLDATTLRGPGVLDAKGGIVVMLAALRALQQSPWAAKIGWEVIFNPDEEIGSPGSAGLLAERAKQNHLGLVFEPALPDGNLVGARKGAGTFTAVVRGRAAHAGRDFDAGRNAIRALARLIEAVPPHPRESIAINVGKIEGGGAVNIVPDLAIGRFNIRAETPDDAAFAESLLREAVASLYRIDGISATLHGRFHSPPKSLDARSTNLMNHIITCARDLGMELSHRPTGGVCDGNKLAAAGLPVVDTLGPVGGGMHSHDEFVIIDSLSQRAKLTALLLLKLASAELPVP